MNEANLKRKVGFKRNENVEKIKAENEKIVFAEKGENYVNITCTDLSGRPFCRSDLRTAAPAVYYRHAVYGNYPGTACFGASG